MGQSDIDHRELFDASPNPYLVLDRDLNIVGANRAYLLAVKRALPDILGRWAWEAFPTDPETERLAIASFRCAIESQNPDTMALLRCEVPRPDGEGGGMDTRYWSITHIPVLGRDEEVALVLQHLIDVTELESLRETAQAFAATRPEHAAIFVEGFDVTERTRVAAALDAAERRYRAVLDAIDVGFCIVEMRFDADRAPVDYKILEGNAAYEQQTGLKNSTGRWISELAPGLERHWFDIYGRVALTGEPVRFENHAEPLGRWYDVHALRIGAAEDRHVAILFNDITDRRRMEDELRALNAQLATRAEERTRERDAIWDASRDLFVTIDADGRYGTVNPAWTAALGWTAADLVGADFAAFVHPDDLPAVQMLADRVELGEDIEEVDLRMRTHDSGHRWISWNIVRRDGIFYAAGRDITDRRQLEDQLRQAQKMEAVGQLTGGLAHDFNNLLTAVTGGLELLGHRIASGRTDGLDRYINMAQSGAQRAAALTQRLLAFSRRQTLDPTPTDVDRLVAGMEEIVARTLGPSIDIKVVATAGLWPVLVDAPQLENALLNLCINARDAMPDGGKLTIETGNKSLDHRAAAEQDLPEGHYVSLCVTDTGTGMSADVIARVFDPFFTTKAIGEGTGLGLSMIYGFVRQSGGQVRIYSEVGHGTTMCLYLYLPRHLGDGEAAQRESVALDRPRGTAGETVLVVEDEEAIRSLMHEILADAGYRVLEARNGPAGVHLLQSDERIDLLITDVGLPGGLNGRQVADAGRVARPDLKVLFVTGYAANAAVGGGHMDAGMAVLTKPFNILDLERRVREMISA